MSWNNYILHLNERLNGCRKILNEVFYGMTAYELEAELKKEKGNLITFLC